MDEEARRFDVQLFRDILTDRDERVAALVALAGIRFVSMLDAWQMIRQGLTTGADSGWTASCGRLGQLC
jgi:hypothetical protein